MLTDPACKNAQRPADKTRVRLADAGGLYLEVTPNGAKRWFWKYRFSGKEKRLALGNYSDPGSPHDSGPGQLRCLCEERDQAPLPDDQVTATVGAGADEWAELAREDRAASPVVARADVPGALHLGSIWGEVSICPIVRSEFPALHGVGPSFLGLQDNAASASKDRCSTVISCAHPHTWGRDNRPDALRYD